MFRKGTPLENLCKVFVVILVLSQQYCDCGKINQGRCPASRYPKQRCTINEVIIDPCGEGTQAEPCRFKRGTSFKMFVSYTPEFSSEKVKALAYWDGTGLGFPGMSTESCRYTDCPVTPNVQHNFTQNVPIANYFPPGRYPVAWRLWNEKNEQCCFTVHIKLI